MGRMLGAHDPGSEIDRPDLNKCPDCGCFFEQDECPLCGMTCPEEMRAGNRKPVRKSRVRNSGSGRVTFIEWYHSWWFIILMMIFMPIVGIILLATSPHNKSHKIAVISVAVIYSVISFMGAHNIIENIKGMFETTVNTSLSREEYIDACEEVSPEQYYRSTESYDGKFVTTTLTVTERVTDVYGSKSSTYYICRDADSDKDFEIIIRDCILDEESKFIAGDVLTVYGEGAGEATVMDSTYNEHILPCINVAYATRIVDEGGN